MDESLQKSTSNNDIEDESNVITLDEFIEEETRLETDANAVLGPSDDKNCTYSQGYMGRQALYACRTCRSEGGDAKIAGVCLACTYHCHEGHDLIELYTKRNFRCDCGNTRFKDKKCNLEPNKDAENTGNSYNHNFDGLYCTCKKPYPDPDDSTPDEMIQCIICEDWYHTRHLHAELPAEENYSEMICCDCTERLPFLENYFGYSVTKVTKEENSSVDVVTNGDKSKLTSVTDVTTNGDTSKIAKEDETTKFEDVNNSDSSTVVKEESTLMEVVQNGESSKVPVIENTTVGGPSNGDTSSPHKSTDIMDQPSGSSLDKKNEVSDKSRGCLLEGLKKVKREKKGATFWPHNFRSLLCACTSCKEMYSTLSVSSLADSSDTVQSYEEKGNSSSSGESKHSMDRVLSMLSNIGMDRFSQAEAILNYNDLKSNLRDYLSKFVESKKVVREEDIHEFFTQMKARKRQKLDLPYNCR